MDEGLNEVEEDEVEMGVSVYIREQLSPLLPFLAFMRRRGL